MASTDEYTFGDNGIILNGDEIVGRGFPLGNTCPLEEIDVKKLLGHEGVTIKLAFQGPLLNASYIDGEWLLTNGKVTSPNAGFGGKGCFLTLFDENGGNNFLENLEQNKGFEDRTYTFMLAGINHCYSQQSFDGVSVVFIGTTHNETGEISQELPNSFEISDEVVHYSNDDKTSTQEQIGNRVVIPPVYTSENFSPEVFADFVQNGDFGNKGFDPEMTAFLGTPLAVCVPTGENKGCFLVASPAYMGKFDTVPFPDGNIDRLVTVWMKKIDLFCSSRPEVPACLKGYRVSDEDLKKWEEKGGDIALSMLEHKGVKYEKRAGHLAHLLLILGYDFKGPAIRAYFKMGDQKKDLINFLNSNVKRLSKIASADPSQFLKPALYKSIKRINYVARGMHNKQGITLREALEQIMEEEKSESFYTLWNWFVSRKVYLKSHLEDKN
jgi:hypothetical protein